MAKEFPMPSHLATHATARVVPSRARLPTANSDLTVSQSTSLESAALAMITARQVI